jgi:hypothetical protein
MNEPTQLDILATRLVDRTQRAWADLVDISLALPEERIDSAAETLAKNMGTRKDTVKRKMQAIQYAAALAHSPADIKKAGQEVTLGRYVKKSNADRYEQPTVMKWNLPGSLREVIRKDMARIAKVLGFVTSEQLWDFIHSILVDLTADDLKHLAGMFSKKSELSKDGQKQLSGR